jgi:hypothetical protein
MNFYDMINIADKEMFRKILKEADSLDGDSYRYMVADITEELELRWEGLHPGQDSLEEDIGAKAQKELYSLVRDPEKPTPILDEVCDLCYIRSSLSGLPASLMDEFIRAYGPDAGLEPAEPRSEPEAEEARQQCWALELSRGKANAFCFRYAPDAEAVSEISSFLAENADKYRLFVEPESPDSRIACTDESGGAPLYREQEQRISEFLKDTMKYPMVMSGALSALKAKDR